MAESEGGGGTEEVGLEFKVKEPRQAHREISGLIGSVTKLGEKVDHVSHLFGTIGTLGAAAAGGFGIERMFEATTEHLDTLKRIRDMTGLAVDRADGLVEAFEKVGVPGEEVATILLRMNGRMDLMNDGLMGAASSTGGMAAQMRKLGVDMKKGPEAAILSLAKGAKEGRIHIGELTRLGIRYPMAESMMKVLRKGPEYIRDTMREMRESGMAVDEQTINTFTQVKEMKSEILAGWKRVSIVVGKELLPVIQQLLGQVSARLPTALHSAAAVGGVLARHMGGILTAVGTIGKLMLGNFALMKVTGTGLVGNLAKALQFAMPKGIESAFKSWGAFGKEFLPGALKLGGIGAGLLVVAEGLSGLVDYIEGKSGRIPAMWDAVATNIEQITSQLDVAFGERGGANTFLQSLMPNALMAVTQGWAYLIAVIRAGAEAARIWWSDVTLMISSHIDNLRKYGLVQGSKLSVAEMGMMNRARGYGQAGRAFGPFGELLDQYISEIDLNRTKPTFGPKGPPAGYRPTTPSERGGTHINQDFRGSRFDIKQDFGNVDPERIAVAFTNDLARVGERKLQSGFAPLFSVRG